MNIRIAYVALYCIISAMLYTQVEGHGRLMEPPSRASMWRFGFNTPPNYDDNQLFCGGFSRQWDINNGKCGVCGDPYDGPRDHEAGGKYATGTIVEHYSEGQTINVQIQITASHRGYFEFRLCPHNNPRDSITQQCLDQHVLRQLNGNTRVYERGFPTNYTVQLVLPRGVTCSQCVLQWKYNTGNSYGCEGSRCCVGCGHQEQFYGCSDISIGVSSSGTMSHQLSPQTSNSQAWNQKPVQSVQHGSLYNMFARPVQSVFETQGHQQECKATPQYKAVYPYADQFCIVQCAKRNCPSSEFCTAGCRR